MPIGLVNEAIRDEVPPMLPDQLFDVNFWLDRYRAANPTTGCGASVAVICFLPAAFALVASSELWLLVLITQDF